MAPHSGSCNKPRDFAMPKAPFASDLSVASHERSSRQWRTVFQNVIYDAFI